MPFRSLAELLEWRRRFLAALQGDRGDMIAFADFTTLFAFELRCRADGSGAGEIEFHPRTMLEKPLAHETALRPLRRSPMTDDATQLREALEDLAWQFAYRSNDATRKWLHTGGLSALEGAFEVLGWDDPHYIEDCGCEHPGCTAWATCGTPTPSGYQRLCGPHYHALAKTPKK